MTFHDTFVYYYHLLSLTEILCIFLVFYISFSPPLCSEEKFSLANFVRWNFWRAFSIPCRVGSILTKYCSCLRALSCCCVRKPLRNWRKNRRERPRRGGASSRNVVESRRTSTTPAKVFCTPFPKNILISFFLFFFFFFLLHLCHTVTRVIIISIHRRAVRLLNNKLGQDRRSNNTLVARRRSTEKFPFFSLSLSLSLFLSLWHRQTRRDRSTFDSPWQMSRSFEIFFRSSLFTLCVFSDTSLFPLFFPHEHAGRILMLVEFHEFTPSPTPPERFFHSS